MPGLSLTITWLDDELEELWRASAASPAYRKGAIELSATAPANAPEARGVPRPESDDALMQLTPMTLVALERVRATLETHQDELGQLDAYAGDGDHGIGMVRGATAAERAAKLAVQNGSGAFVALQEAADGWSERAGGTSGALWGAAIDAVAVALRNAGRVDEETIIHAVDAGLTAVQRLGGAKPGDKTMVDAFVPFAAELRHQHREGATLADAWREAVTRASEAAAATAELSPKLGRARPLAERSIGHPDAGAVSFSHIVRALAGIEGLS
jgi:dihydroxyacetone kinase